MSRRNAGQRALLSMYLKDCANAAGMDKCPGSPDARDGLGNDIQEDKVVPVAVKSNKDLVWVHDPALEFGESVGT